jgi:hypothetical protein
MVDYPSQLTGFAKGSNFEDVINLIKLTKDSSDPEQIQNLVIEIFRETRLSPTFYQSSPPIYEDLQLLLNLTNLAID